MRSFSQANTSLWLLAGVIVVFLASGSTADTQSSRSGTTKTKETATAKQKSDAMFAAIRAIGGENQNHESMVGNIVSNAMKKKLLEMVISKLGKPCDGQCALQRKGPDATACMDKCKRGKGQKLAGILQTLRGASPSRPGIRDVNHQSPSSPKGKSRSNHLASRLREASRGRRFARNKPSTEYPNGVFGVDGPNVAVIRSDAFSYAEAKEGHCSSSVQVCVYVCLYVCVCVCVCLL
jgi:hypothetical protein